MSFSPLIDDLINAFRCLPGIGAKSAQRMAFHILERNREGGLVLSTSLARSIAQVGQCEDCRTLCETAKCRICASDNRCKDSLCVVETPADILAIERAGGFYGTYFVLMGKLSPIDGIGPEELGLDKLEIRLDNSGVKEVIIATNPTVEGETTAYYISELAKKRNVKVTRIAHGVPMGGELEYLDGGTVSRALLNRSEL